METYDWYKEIKKTYSKYYAKKIITNLNAYSLLYSKGGFSKMSYPLPDLMGLFIWRDTPEGYDYWSKLFHKMVQT